MNLSCNVAKDLLPLYHDGVCSDESRALVEEHLKDCERCRALLKELRGEIEVPHESPDDLGAMKKLEANVNRGKKRAWIKGAAAVLAVVLVLGASLAGLNDYENRKYQDQFARFGEGHEKLENSDDGYPYDYDWIHGNYLFRVNVPERGEQGLIKVEEYRWTKDIPTQQDLAELTLYIRFAGDSYLYDIAIERLNDPGAHRWDVITLDQNGQTVDDPNWDEETLAQKNELLETYRTEILNIITAAEREWPFLTE